MGVSHDAGKPSQLAWRTDLATAAMERVRRFMHRQNLLRAGPQELGRLQLAALTGILEAAWKTEPYRRLYGSRPKVAKLDDLRDLPFTDRAYLASFPVEQRITDAADDLEPEPSTGTSGEVMVSMRSPDESTLQVILWMRQLLAQGIGPRERHLVFDFSMDPSAPLELQQNVGRLPGWGPIEMQADAVHSFRPSVLSGPPSCLLELAECIGPFPVRSLGTFGEVVTPEDRAELRHYFGAATFDLYSASETGHISWQCARRDGYHVNSDTLLVEVLDDEDRPVPPGEAGHIVITTLWNPTMPVIRYRIGDIGMLLPDQCECGITLPLMGPVEGRFIDRLATHDGRRVSAMRMALASVGPYHASIRRWRLVQRSVDDILVEIVWAGEPVPDLAQRMSEGYARALGGPVSVEIREVERFSLPRGRKFRWVESLVPSYARRDSNPRPSGP